MCGITGFFKPSLIDRNTAFGICESMTRKLAHRGPDDSGVWVDESAGIAMGHRRLSIIDLSPNGHQPMFSACGRYIIVFNGEIYNFQQLRLELQSLGRVFRGHSDTEVLLAAVVQWGLKDALTRFNGMFAFALWDSKERTIHLVRDRIGEKPLYYQKTDKHLLFGSELKALFEHPDFRGAIDYEAIGSYFQHGYIPAPLTPFKDTYKLLPGTILSISASRFFNTIQPETYWSASQVIGKALAKPWSGSVPEAEDELHALLLDATRLRMIADVPLGAFLSGGIDSSLIVSLMQAQSARPIRTFTIGFDDGRFDESHHAKAVAKYIGTEHTDLKVTSGQALAVVPRLAGLYDEPMSDSSQIPTYLVAALTRKHVTVSLSGDAGDELFGGYHRYVTFDKVRNFLALLAAPVRSSVSAALRLNRAAESTTTHHLQPINGWMQKLGTAIAAENDRDLYDVLLSRWQETGSFVKGASGSVDRLSKISAVSEPPLGSFQERMMYMDLLAYLPEDILVKVDRASMGASLETRIPMLDQRIIEFAWRLSLGYKIINGTGKVLLRRLLYRYVPAGFFERPKMGFSVPLGRWLRGSLRDWAEELLDEDSIRNEGILEHHHIRRMWRCHLEGRWDRSAYLWDVLIFRSWLREYGRHICKI